MPVAYFSPGERCLWLNPGVSRVDAETGQSLCVHVCIVKVEPIGVTNRLDEAYGR